MSDTRKWTPDDDNELERRITKARRDVESRKAGLKDAKLCLKKLEEQKVCDHDLKVDYQYFRDEVLVYSVFICTKCKYVTREVTYFSKVCSRKPKSAIDLKIDQLHDELLYLSCRKGEALVKLRTLKEQQNCDHNPLLERP